MLKEIPSLHILKAFCAFFVICLHCSFTGRNLIIPIIKIAVPCFYIISGYFLVDNNGTLVIIRTKKQLRKLVLLSIIANIAYFFFWFFKDDKFFFSIFQLKTILRICLYGDVLGDQLWFLNAYIEVLLIVLILEKIKGRVSISSKYLPLIGLLLLTAPLFGKYSFLLGRQFNELWFRNVFNIALPFMYVGAMVRKHRERILNVLNRKKIWAILLSLASLSYIEYVIQFYYPQLFLHGDMNIVNIFFPISVFVACLWHHEYLLESGEDLFHTPPTLCAGCNETLVAIIKKTMAVCKNWLIGMGRAHSTNIYLIHFMFVYLFWSIAPGFMERGHPLLPFVVLILSLLLSAVINKTKAVFRKGY